MIETLEILFTRVWWTWDSRDDQWFSHLYHGFNLLEGAVWLVLAGLVLRRYLKHRNSLLEICYSVAFLTFAASDFREAWQQSSWLIWLKLMNLLALLWIRGKALRQWYPGATVY